MTTVKVIIEGYARETKTGWLASSSTTLITDGDKKIVVDPGINRALLLEKLKGENLKPGDIDLVFITHYHPDHSYLAAIFENAILCDFETTYDKDLETEYSGTLPGTTVKVISTPGHAHEHASLVCNTKDGVIVIAADLFWWTENDEQKINDYDQLINREDPFTKDASALKASRKTVLKIADFIIPGHGQMFKNPHKGR